MLPPPMLQPVSLEVVVLRAEGLEPVDYYVRLSGGRDAYNTNFAQGANPVWNTQAYVFHLPGPGTLAFDLWQDCGGPWDDTPIGRAKLPSSGLDPLVAAPAVEIPLDVSLLGNPEVQTARTARLWISARVLGESRSPGVQVSRGPSSMAPVELCFDPQAFGRAWERLNAAKVGSTQQRGIMPGANPLTDLSYVGAGFISRTEGWDGGMNFGPVAHITQKHMDTSKLCSRYLEIFTGHHPRVLQDSAVTCLKAFLELVGKREVPYIPILAHGIQLRLKFKLVGGESGQEPYPMPTADRADYNKSYCIWSLVDDCLEGLKQFLMSHNCWESRSPGVQAPPAGADRPSSNVRSLESWFPLMQLGCFDPCPSERACMGKPVISSQSPWLPQIQVHGHHGLHLSRCLPGHGMGADHATCAGLYT